MKGKIYCGKCGGEFSPSMCDRKDGDLDIRYIQCPHCKEEYLVSVTDSVLRDAIQDYQLMMEKARTAADTATSEEISTVARQMKETNSKRCFELMAEYYKDKEQKR